MKCQQCNTEIPAGATTCPNCGAQVPQQLAPARSRIAYIVLALFCGCLGIHNFYAGYTRKAVIQLLITVLTLGIGSIVTGIWAIVDICTVKASSDGQLMN